MEIPKRIRSQRSRMSTNRPYPDCPSTTASSSAVGTGKNSGFSRAKRSKPRSLCTEISVPHEFPECWVEFRENQQLCDATIKSSDGQVFHVHRCLMAAASPYFKVLLTNPFQFHEQAEQITETALSFVHSSILKQIIDFAYTGKCEITAENVEKILPLADQYQMTGIIQLACQFLSKEMEPHNCLGIYKFAKAYFCNQLESKAKIYILQNFREIIEHPEFKELSFEDVENLLREDHLNAKNEEQVFEAIQMWTEHDPLNRTVRLGELLQCIRFGLMNYNHFTTEVLNWKYVLENEVVQASLFEASMFLTQTDTRQGTDVDLNDPLARPRVPFEIVFAVGGWSAGSPTSFMETYDSKADRWFLISSSDVTPRAYHGLVTLNQMIYMIGGFDGQEHFNTVRCFDPISKLWNEKSNMYHARCYVSCCVLDGKIFAMGGYNGRTRMNSVERYSPEQNQWDMMPAMNRQRSDASACSLNGKLYIAGGFNGQEVLNSVEMFDPAENQWTFLYPMSSPRSGVSLVSYKNRLYAIGGFNGINRLNTAERYDPQRPGDWQIIPQMSSPRSNFAAVVVEDMIFVIGGFNGTTTISFVECFDGNSNEWFDATAMNLNRSALSACVLKALPNSREFSYLSRVQEILGLNNT